MMPLIDCAFKQKALKQTVFVVFAELCLEKRFKIMLYSIPSFRTKFQKKNYKENLTTKTTKGTTRVPEISHLRAGSHSKSNEEG